MSAFVIALSIPLLPVFGAVKLGEAAIRANKNGTTIKNELTNILNENDSSLIEKFHKETKAHFNKEINDFIAELKTSNISNDEILKIQSVLQKFSNEWDGLLKNKIIKKDKIFTVYDITLSELQKLAQEKFLELKEIMNDTKTKILINRQKNFQILKEETRNTLRESENEKPDYKNDILNYLNLLKNIDRSLYDKYQQLTNGLNNYSSQRAKLILKEIKLAYTTKMKELGKTEIYKEELRKLLTNNPETKYKKEIENTLNQKTISKNEFERLYMSLLRESTLNNYIKDQKHSLAKNLTALLKQSGYVIIENEENIINRLTENERIIIPIKNGEYELIMKLTENNEILTRFVKKVENPDNISTSEKLQDKYELKKWCNIQRNIYEKLKKDFLLNVKIIEDDETEILYIIDNKTDSTNQQKAIHGQNSFGKQS